MKTVFSGVLSEQDGPVTCPCGEDHSARPGWPSTVDIVTKLGPLIDVTTPAGTWRVPRVFILMHGLKAMELAALADKYGWEKVR
jgi:hypothetical protein